MAAGGGPEEGAQLRGAPQPRGPRGHDRAVPSPPHANDSAPVLSVRLRRLAIVGIAAVAVAADQLTKSWALRHALVPVHVVWTLQWAVTFNSGTAFGLGQGSTPFIIGGVVVLVVVLLGVGRRASRRATWPAAVAMGLLLGGALGNLADRLVRHHGGAVIDFIDFRWWPVFNVADACVSVGAVLLALVLFRSGEGEHPDTGRGEAVTEPAGVDRAGG